MKNIEEISVDKILNPPSEISPAYFWSLNAEIDKEKFSSQLKDMLSHGARSVCVHPLPSGFRPLKFANELKPEYLSAEYMELIKFAAEFCRHKNMNFYLYDEGGWPSGGACGKVFETNPSEFAPKVLLIDKKKKNWTVCESKSQTEVSPPVPSLFSKEATKEFINLTHELFKKETGSLFGGTIKFTFTDEPALPTTRFEKDTIQLSWYDEFPIEFKKRRGYDIFKLVRALADGSESTETIEMLIDYYDFRAEKFRDNFLRPLKQWCRQNNLRSGGHFGGEDIPEGNARHGFGHILRSLRELDLPGIDCIWRQIYPKNGIPFYPKYAQSAARQSDNDEKVLSESFMVYGAGLTPAEMKWIIDIQLSQGVTNFIFGHYPYCADRHFMLFCRPVFGPLNPFWEFMPEIHKYTETAAALLSMGTSDCHSALYFPIRDIWAGGKYTERAVNSHNTTAKNLLKIQCDFDFIDDDLLLPENVRNGVLYAGKAKYDTILLPAALWLTEKAVETLKLFRKGGGGVFAWEAPPSAKGGQFPLTMPDSAVIKDIQGLKKNFPAALKTETPAPELLVNKRKCGKESIYFIFNSAMKNIRNKITFNENSPAVAIDLFNRKFNRVKTEKTSDSQSIQLELAAGETKVFIFSENPEKFNPRKENTPLKLKKHTEITGKWKIKPLKQWIAGSNNIKIRETGFTETESELKDWSEIKEIDKNFSGEVLYSMDFRFEGYKKGHRYYIDLGAMDYAARIELNGKNTGTVLSRPFRSDITDFLREGRNILKIRATNSLANTIRSEETQQAWERNIGRSWPAISPPYHKRQLEFEELNTKGGLKGPVRIFEEQVR